MRCLPAEKDPAINIELRVIHANVALYVKYFGSFQEKGVAICDIDRQIISLNFASVDLYVINCINMIF
jgi:hypothetical protein